MSIACGVTDGGGGDVRQVGGNTRGVHDIVESKLVNERGELQEQRQRLGIWRQQMLSRTSERLNKPVRYRQRHQQRL
jgi:hypothetical protein